MQAFIIDLVLLMLCELGVILFATVATTSWYIGPALLGLLFTFIMSILALYFFIKVVYYLFLIAKTKVLANINKSKQDN